MVEQAVQLFFIGRKEKIHREATTTTVYWQLLSSLGYATVDMKISLRWLQDFIDLTEKDPQVIASRITAHTAEVDEVEQQGSILQHCCVGEVLSLSKHPNADKLSLCEVKTDQGVKKVVCGGTNITEGMKVAFAHIGATVRWHGSDMMTLEKTKIRGETSEGMICAAEELDLQDRCPPTPEDGERPVVALDASSKDVGKGLQEFFGTQDTVYHIDNHAITHRADLFSHRGFAREFVAMGIAKWKKDIAIPVPSFGKDAVPFKLHIQDSKLMPRYCACVIEIDDIGETPDWMKARLEAVGWRSINLPIDITNFVSSEAGVPLHSFDLDDLKGDVHMRVSKKGEKIITLDKQERTLPEGALILSDDEGIFDLLGIMGGLRSSTKVSTKRIYLHSASLNPVSIRNTVIATGHRTDAATTYEKGVPHITTELGFYRAVQLFLELVPGAKIVSKMESVGENGTEQTISLSPERVSLVLGKTIPTKTIISILQSLDFAVEDKKSELVVTVPLYRGDITGAHDLIEEIGRIYGYDKIDEAMPLALVQPPARDFRMHQMRDALKEEAFLELLPLSLVSPKLLEKCLLNPEDAVKIENPLGEELSLMTPSTLPALLEHAEKNLLSAGDTLSTFHISNVFHPDASQHLELGAFLAQRDRASIKQEPLLLLKAGITHALQQAGYEPEYLPSKKVPAYAHPGRTAEVKVAGSSIGHLFAVHPTLCEKFDLPEYSAASVLDLDALFAVQPTKRIAKDIPQYPAITYDATFTLDQSKRSADVLEKLQKASPLLEKVEIADLYSGKPLAENQYNLTLRFVYRALDRTLTEEEVKKEHEKAEQVLKAMTF